jgi:hypothetical protein
MGKVLVLVTRRITTTGRSGKCVAFDHGLLRELVDGGC